MDQPDRFSYLDKNYLALMAARDYWSIRECAALLAGVDYRQLIPPDDWTDSAAEEEIAPYVELLLEQVQDVPEDDIPF